jgi:hypothetical protein
MISEVERLPVAIALLGYGGFGTIGGILFAKMTLDWIDMGLPPPFTTVFTAVLLLSTSPLAFLYGWKLMRGGNKDVPKS